MLCSDTVIQVGETRTVEDCTIKLKQILFNYAYLDITAPWGTFYEKTIVLGGTITIERTSNEYIELTFLANMSDTAAKLNVCYAKEIELGSLFCESVPSGAEVYYKKEYMSAYEYMGTTTVWIEDVPPGERYIKMTLDGYETHEDSYEVEPGAITGVNINLVPLVTTGTLSCNTTPSGANIYLNDVYQGLTNKTISNLEPGSYTVKYTKEGYEDYSVTITINAGVISYVTTILQTEPEPTGTLVCHSSPSEAEIWINEANTGEYTSKTFTDMTLGRYKVELKKAGYYSCADLYDIYEGQITTVSCTLVEAITTGQINCSSSPEGASIYLNNVYSGLTNLNIKDLAPGSYVVRFELDGYEAYETTKIVEVGLAEYVSKVLVEITKPQCIDYLAQQECEDNGCYWWTSNDTCQSAPEGTTDYFDIHIKPYSWYEGRYEDALNSALALSANLTGKIANYLSSVTGYEYTGLEIKEDVNKNIIIVRIFLKDINETSLIAPLVVAGLAVVVGAILIGIGYVIGTSQGGFSKSDITQLAEDIVRNAEIDAYEHAYDIDKPTATQLMDCLKTIETCDDSLTCFDNSGVTPSTANQLEVLVAYKTTIDAVYTGVADTVEDPEFEVFAAEALANLEIIIQKLNSATITPEGAACETTDIIDDTIDDLDDKQVEQETDDCVFDIFGNCIITEGALGTILLIGAGIAAIAAYSAMKK